jgi:hypothetical protein
MAKNAFDAEAAYRTYQEQRGAEVAHALRRLQDLGVYVDGLMHHLDGNARFGQPPDKHTTTTGRIGSGDGRDENR